MLLYLGKYNLHKAFLHLILLHGTDLAYSSYSTDPHDLQGSDDQLRLSPLLSLGNKGTPDQTPPAGKGVRPMGDSLLRCSSNPLWWAPGQLAFVGPDGCLQVVQVPSGEQVLYVDTHYFLPGSRIVASLGLYGQGRRMYVLSALIQAARYISLRPSGCEHAPLGVHCVGMLCFSLFVHVALLQSYLVAGTSRMADIYVGSARLSVYAQCACLH